MTLEVGWGLKGAHQRQGSQSEICKSLHGGGLGQGVRATSLGGKTKARSVTQQMKENFRNRRDHNSQGGSGKAS